MLVRDPRLRVLASAREELNAAYRQMDARDDRRLRAFQTIRIHRLREIQDLSATDNLVPMLLPTPQSFVA